MIAALLAFALLVMPVSHPAPRATVSVSHALTGIATFYADPRKPQGSTYAAAGPRLRAALGSHWRGRTVRVCAGRCVSVRLGDWCGCPYGRVIDLSWSAFLRLGVPLSRGIVKVGVTW